MSHKYRFSDWLDMYRHRHCPSLATLRRGGPQAEEHLRSCAHCRTALEHSESSAALGKLLMSLPVQQPPASPPRPGDIRALSPRRNPDSWLDEDIYHNPPLVFVLEEPDALGLIRVAQVCPETSLKDDGDVPLGLELLAETWNIYTVPVADLEDVPYAHPGTELVNKVLEAAATPFPEPDRTSALFLFREDEKLTGAFFHHALTRELTAQEEERPTARIIPFAIAPRDHAARQPRTRASQGRLAFLLQQEWSPTALPMAAAGMERGDADALPAQRVIVTLSRPDVDGGTPHPHAAEVHCRPLPGKTLCVITCAIKAPLPVAMAAVRCREEDALEVNAAWQNEETLEVCAMFEGTNVTAAHLRVAILLAEE